jgi:hypothetical protein
MEPSCQINRVKFASATTVKVAGLSISVRESYLGLLADALKKNVEVAANEGETTDHKLVYKDYEDVAAELEYQSFTNNKVITLYKRCFIKSLAEVKNSTNLQQLYPVLKTHVPVKRNAVGGDYQTILEDIKRRYGDEVAESIDGDKEEEKRKKELRDCKKKLLRVAHGVTKDFLNQPKINSFFDKISSSSSNSSSSSTTAANTAPAKEEDDEGDTKLVIVEQEENSNAGSVSPLLENISDEEDHMTFVDDLPTASGSVAETDERKKAAKRKRHEDLFGVLDELDFLEPKQARHEEILSPVPMELSTPEERSPERIPINSINLSISPSLLAETPCTSAPKPTAEPSVAKEVPQTTTLSEKQRSKLESLFEPTPKPKAVVKPSEPLKIPASIKIPQAVPHKIVGAGDGNKKQDDKKMKQKTSDVVIKHLMPFYKTDRIKTKDLFKGLARNLSHKFYNAVKIGKLFCWECDGRK